MKNFSLLAILVAPLLSTWAFCSTQVHFAQQIRRAPTVTTIQAPGSISADTQVPFSISVASMHLPPDGNVTLTEGTNVLGTAPLKGANATISTAFSTGGQHSIVACYQGTVNFTESCSNPFSFFLPIFSLSAPSQTGQVEKRRVFTSPVTVTPEGFTGVVKLSCSTDVARLVECSIAPNEVQLDGNTPIQARLAFHVYTTPNSASAILLFLPTLCLGCFSKRLRLVSTRLLVVFGALILTLGTNGCGSGFVTPMPYNVTVKATSGNYSKTLSFVITLMPDNPSVSK
jgi:hypothetical protein